MPRAAKILSWCTLPVLLVAALLAPARAGAEEETLLDRLGIDSKYESKYDVTKRETDWRQTMTISRTTALSDLSTSLHSKNREDESRNDFNEALNRIQLHLARTFSFGEAFTDARLRRHWTETTRSRTDIEENTLQLGNTVPLLQRRSTSLGLTFRGGWIQEKEVKRQFRRGLIVDSTLATGWSGKFDMNGSWEPSATLSWTGGASFDGSIQESQSRHWQIDEEGSTVETEELEATDNTRGFNARSDLVWMGHNLLRAALTSSYSDGYAQFYQATERTQETQWVTRQSAALNLEGDITETLNYGVDYSTKVAEFDYDVQDKDRLERDQTLSLRGRHVLGVPVLSGATAKASISFAEGRRSVQNTTAYDTRGKSLEGEVQKPLGRKATIGARAMVDLTQDFYDDGSLDKDLLRTDISLAAAYTPSQAFTATGGYTANRRETINIAAERSAQNQVRRSYQVTAGYTTTLPGKVGLRQNFLLSADYTYYVFNEDENTLTRTNRVTTKVDVPLWERSMARLEHIFHRSDSGAYRFPEQGSTRVYSKSSERLRQYIKVILEYDLSRVVHIEAMNTYDLNYRTTLASDQTTLRDKLTFSGLVGIQKELGGDLTLRASFRKTASTQEDDYWDIDAQVQKDF